MTESQPHLVVSWNLWSIATGLAQSRVVCALQQKETDWDLGWKWLNMDHLKYLVSNLYNSSSKRGVGLRFRSPRPATFRGLNPGLVNPILIWNTPILWSKRSSNPLLFTMFLGVLNMTGKGLSIILVTASYCIPLDPHIVGWMILPPYACYIPIILPFFPVLSCFCHHEPLPKPSILPLHPRPRFGPGPAAWRKDFDSPARNAVTRGASTCSECKTSVPSERHRDPSSISVCKMSCKEYDPPVN